MYGAASDQECPFVLPHCRYIGSISREESSLSNSNTMATKDIHVGLVGAGIGGLTAAIALRRAGARVTVFEAAQVLGEVRGS